MSTSGPSSRKIRRVEEDHNGGAGSDDDDQQDSQATFKALSDLIECQKGLEQLDKMTSNEMNQVNNTYNKLRKPFYDKRAVLIEKIPKFWLNAIVTDPRILGFIDVMEKDCLHFLKKLEVEHFENSEEGCRIKFIFDENPFFENAELIKEFHFGPNRELIYELRIESKSTSTTIKWKGNMDLSKKQQQILEARRKRGQKKMTFLSWFSDNADRVVDDIAYVITYILWTNPVFSYRTSGLGDYAALEEEEAKIMNEEDDDGAGERVNDDGTGDEEDDNGSGDEEGDYGLGDEEDDDGSGDEEGDYVRDEEDDDGSGDEEGDYGLGDEEDDAGSGDEEGDYGLGDEEDDDGSGDEEGYYGLGDEEDDDGSGDEEGDYGLGDEEDDDASGDEDKDDVLGIFYDNSYGDEEEDDEEDDEEEDDVEA
ncbi:unnamed protein product [Orchesella dallaii]|uniref:Protein SET n=1 Tax=Orchesella dallaii TaxID=48710 RepID=A0ABP1R7H4_9HEXA